MRVNTLINHHSTFRTKLSRPLMPNSRNFWLNELQTIHNNLNNERGVIEAVHQVRQQIINSVTATFTKGKKVTIVLSEKKNLRKNKEIIIWKLML